MRATLWMLALAACGTDADVPLDTAIPAAELRGDCNPVEGDHCMLPYPSSFFLADDDSTPTGKRIDFGPTTLPLDVDDVQMDPTAWNRADGFPVLGELVALLPGALPAGATDAFDAAPSMLDDSPTILVNAETGERVPHFIERERVARDEARTVLVIHPMAPMDHASTYVAGIRGLVDADGVVVAAPEGFAALRDATDSTDPDLERQRDRYEDIVFPALEAQGWQRDEVQLAWDFVTASAEHSLAPLRHMRDEGLALVGEAGPAYRIDSVSEGDCDAGDRVYRSIDGHMSVPSYLETHEPVIESRLRWGDDGLPEVVEDVEVPFRVRVPCSLVLDGVAGRPLQFGHGLFGTWEDVGSSNIDKIASEHHFVSFGVSWTGMAREDATAISLALVNDASDFAMLTDRLHQAQLEALLMQRLMLTGLARAEELQHEGRALIDPSEVVYYGYSQGSVLGGAQVALSPYVDRGVLGVPGAPFSLLLTRAANFEPFFKLLQVKMEDDVDVSMFIALSQVLWDATDSGGWAWQLNEADDGAGANTFLLQAAVGDLSVSTVGAQTLARSIDAGHLQPAPREVYGLDPIEPETTRSSLLEMDWGYPEPDADTVLKAGEVGSHGEPWGSDEARAQAGRFLDDGVIIEVCDGACDPD